MGGWVQKQSRDDVAVDLSGFLCWGEDSVRAKPAKISGADEFVGMRAQVAGWVSWVWTAAEERQQQPKGR